jgi:hypothetical protein
MVRWPEQQPLSADPGGAPVLVRTTYTIAADKEQQFLSAMPRLRQSRRRTGAVDWIAAALSDPAPRADHYLAIDVRE